MKKVLMINTNITKNFMKNLNNDDKWNQWFAGLTDGDGCFYITKKEKTVSYEITAHATDIRLLYNIKNKLKAGSVTLRSGSQSVRYRIKQQSIIIDIVKRLNGKLYNPARIIQFKDVCFLYNIALFNHPVRFANMMVIFQVLLIQMVRLQFLFRIQVAKIHKLPVSMDEYSISQC